MARRKIIRGRKVVGLESLSLDVLRKLLKYGDRAVLLLSEKLAQRARMNVPLLSAYGEQNARLVPHRNKARRGEVRDEICTIPSIKYAHSRLVDARSWRSHFIEYGAKRHVMPASRSRVRPYAFLGYSKKGRGKKSAVEVGGMIVTKKVIHPGMKGKGFMSELTDPAVVNPMIDAIIKSLEV